MSDQTNLDPAHARAARSSSPGRPATTRRGGAGLALLLALLAVLGAAYVGWRQWQPMHGDAIDTLRQRVAELLHADGDQQAERSALQQKLDDAMHADTALHAEVQSQSDRLRALENAVARLSSTSQSSHDMVLLDEVESLLRMADERYALFHDAAGAAQAYAQAGQAAAAISDGAYAGLRQRIDSERQALEKAAQAVPPGTAQALAALRGQLGELPLKPLDQASEAGTGTGAWTHIRNALVGVISVQRDDGSLLASGDARFTRDWVALDLAQAQAAVLAYDQAAATAMLQQAKQGLSVQFDPQSPAVQQALAQLDSLLSQLKPMPPVTLGAALEELHDLRAVHTLNPPAGPAPPTPGSPAPTSSAAGGAKP